MCLKSRVSVAICALLLSSVQLIYTQTSFEAIDMSEFGDGVRHWYGIKDKSNIVDPVPNQPVYAENEITEIADNILLYQRNNGGWPKNYDMRAKLTPEQKQKLLDTKNQNHTTFDNSTTYTHIAYLAKVYNKTKIEKYRTACEAGIQFCFDAQFKNGGWPQYYPLEDGYSRHITFNDGAFLGVLKLMRAISLRTADYAFLDKKISEKAAIAYNKGLDCILNCQIVDNGELTVWCQQHDEVTLKPAWARAFEPPVICNGESSDIVLYLMSIENPSDRIIKSVQAAYKWYNTSKILNTSVKRISIKPEESTLRTVKSDVVVVYDSTSKPIWTRYYEPATRKPLFCDRDSKYLYSLAEVSLERRSGYAWYVTSPQKVIDKYPAWEKKVLSTN